MTVAEFHRWEAEQPGDERYELFHGEIVRMQSERVRHTVVKANVYRALQDAVRAAKLPCFVFTDGVTVDITDEVSYRPDAAIQCGVSIDLDATTIEEPMVIVEVTSPSTAKTDATVKMADYFTRPSVAHVLIIDPENKRILKHTRTDATKLSVEVLSVDDHLTLEHPGLQIQVADFFFDT